MFKSVWDFFGFFDFNACSLLIAFRHNLLECFFHLLDRVMEHVEFII